MSNIVGSLKVLLSLDSAEFTSGLTRAEAVAAKFADKQKRNQASIDRQVKSLQNQAAQVGRTAQEIKLMELAQKGATAEQLRAADAALRSVAAHELAQQQMAAVKVGAAAMGLALGTAAVAYAAFLKNQLDAVDAFNDVADATGASIENISGLDDVARRTGGTFEDVGSALLKLNNSLKDADGIDAQSRAIKALGLDLESLKALDPAEAFLQIAIALAGFDDNATKSRYELLLFGKQTKETAHLLKDLGEQGKLVAKTTTEQAEAIERYNKNLSEMKANVEDASRSLLNSLVPAFNETIKKLKDGAAEGKSFLAVIASEQWKILGRLFNISGEEPFAARAERIKAIQKLLEDQNLPLERRLRLEKQLAGIQPATLDSKAGGGRGFVNPDVVKPDLPELSADNGESALKKRLEGQLQAIRDFADQQRDAYEFANRYVEGAYANGLIGLEEFLDAQKRVREAALVSQLQSLDKEIALQKDAASRLHGDAQLDAQNKLAKAIEDRSQAAQRAAQDEILIEQKRVYTVEQARRRYVDLIATIKELSGDTKGAAADRIARQVQDAEELIKQSGGDPRKAATYGKALTDIESLRQAQDDYQKFLERTATKEEEVGLAAQASGATEIETLRATGAARSKALTELSALVDKANELALSSNGNKDAIAFAERLGIAFKKASAEVDPLLQKVRDVGKELGQGLGDIFGEATRQGEGLKGILANIGDLVSQIATKELISKPLGDMFSNFLGGTGKDGGALGSIFGVGSGAGGSSGVNAAAAATTTSFTTLQTIGIDPTVLALQRFQAQLATTGATGSGSGGSGGGWVDLLAGLFGFSGDGYSYNGGTGTTNAAGISGGRANGGLVGAGGVFEVAEKRPELLDVNGRKFLLMGKQRGRIDPNPQVGGNTGHTVNANIVVQMPPGTSAQTMNQAGAAVARKLQMANRRNN